MVKAAYTKGFGLSLIQQDLGGNLFRVLLPNGREQDMYDPEIVEIPEYIEETIRFQATAMSEIYSHLGVYQGEAGSLQIARKLEELQQLEYKKADRSEVFDGAPIMSLRTELNGELAALRQTFDSKMGELEALKEQIELLHSKMSELEAEF